MQDTALNKVVHPRSPSFNIHIFQEWTLAWFQIYCINKIMLLGHQTPIHSADIVRAGDTGLYRCIYFSYFPIEQSYGCTLSASDAEEQHDRRVQSVCESTFDKV